MNKANDPSHALLEDAQELGHEARAGMADHAALKLWLRLLACTTQIEAEIRRRLRDRFDISLARFDYMAQLFRYREGLKMRVLSRYLMVTGGNVTSLTDELEKAGHVTRQVDAEDRRSYRVALTVRGRRTFERMAAAHEHWVVELLGDLTPDEHQQMHALLGHLRLSLARRTQAES